MTIEEMKGRGLLLMECLSGSRAYDLHTEDSDTDIRGVFIMPKVDFYGLTYTPQISDEKNNEVYYEIGRFTELLLKNNPTALEVLHTHEEDIRCLHPGMQAYRSAAFLSRLCSDTFAGYAYSQVKKARGLKKKVLNPVDKKRKGPADFCYVTEAQQVVPLADWLTRNGYEQQQVGLAKMQHMHDVYAIYIDEPGRYRGVVTGEKANEVTVSEIPKGEKPEGYLSFNRQAYSAHCKEYKNYWTWVEERNESRYKNTLLHGKNYDAKNMMHTFRLLNMAEEIAKEGRMHVRRPDRKELLEIKEGKFSYRELLTRAEEKLEVIKNLFEKSNLPPVPEKDKGERLLINLRNHIYDS